MRGHFLRAAAGNGGVPPWTPDEITTALWLDADDGSTITETSGAVSQWDDKSGNSRNFTGTGATQPTYTASGLNSKAVLDFAADYLTSASAASTWKFLHDATGATVFFVVRPGSASNPDDVYGLFGTNGATVSNLGTYLRWDDRSAEGFNDTLVSVSGQIRSVDIAPNDSSAANTWQAISAAYDNANSTPASRVAHFVNGAALPQNNTNNSSIQTHNPTYTLQIGACGNNVVPLTGGIAEVVIVSGVISAANRERMEGYLAHKWGLEANLPGGHPYKNSPPTI